MFLYQKISVLTGIAFFFLSSISFAQNNKIFSGITTEEVPVNDGRFTVTRTVYFPRGQTVSGTVVVEPESEKTGKQKKQLENLGNYVLKIAGQTIPTGGIFKVALPDEEVVSFEIFFPGGELAREIEMKLYEPIIPLKLKMPEVIRQNYQEKITGDFSGDISEATVLLGEKPAKVIAGNESELFFRTENIEPGKQQLTLDYGDVTATDSVNLVDYSLEAGKLHLNRGETTFIDVRIEGMERIQESLVLEVKNQSEAAISLEGGNRQSIVINPDEVAESGVWKRRFDIQSIARGSFSVFTDLQIPTTEPQAHEYGAESQSPLNVWENMELIGKRAKILNRDLGYENENSTTGAGLNEGISRELLETAVTPDMKNETERPSSHIRRCLKYPADPDIDNRVGWDLFGDLYRKGLLESDYLNDLRAADIHRKQQQAKSLSQSLQIMLQEEYFEGHSCTNNLAHRDRPQQFPEFPWEKVFLTVDLCDELNADKTSLIDFLSSDSEIEALKNWREEFETAVENFGLSHDPPTSMLAFFSNKSSSCMANIDEAYNEFQENMRVALALRYNASQARARMWQAVAFTAGTVLSAGIGSAMAGSMGAALVSVFVSTTGFVYEQGLQTLGMKPEMAQLISAIATAGMGGGAAVGDLVNSATTTTVIEGANTMTRGHVESYSVSMALMNDDNWDKMIENLSEDYRAGAINSFNNHRDQFIGKVREELSDLCELRNSLENLIPATEEAVTNAKLYVSNSFWRGLWNEAMNNALDCGCCQFSDGTNPSNSCRQTIPPFGFTPDKVE